MIYDSLFITYIVMLKYLYRLYLSKLISSKGVFYEKSLKYSIMTTSLMNIDK